jgi:hypothetical protein
MNKLKKILSTIVKSFQPVSHLNVDFQTLSVVEVEAVFPAEDSLDDLDEEIKMIVARGQTKIASHDEDPEVKHAGEETILYSNCWIFVSVFHSAKPLIICQINKLIIHKFK